MDIYNQPWRLVQNRIRGRGGRETDKLRGIHPPVDDDSGSESWIGSTTPVGRPPADKPHYGCSEVILPDGRRMYLHEAFALSPEKILGSEHIKQNGTGMGMLIKFLDAQYQYGLQCHPTREWAKKMWDSDYGKEESWYVIGLRNDVQEVPYILLGFKEGVTRQVWERHYYNDDLPALENLCHKIPVQVGEAYFLGGGLPHALGQGCFVVEVQEPCDITLGAHTYDYAKKNWKGWGTDGVDGETYNERLLGAYGYDGCSYEENLKRWRIPRKCIRRGGWGKEEIVIGTAQTRYFSFTELTLNGETELLDSRFPKVAIVLNGAGSILHGGGEMTLAKGDEVFIPYNVPGARVKGELTIVLCHPEGAVWE
jgi:mannose-6-phosphate isomerase